VIIAPLFVVQNGDERNWGSFRFDQLPSQGDKINITDHRGRVQRLNVLHITHEPLREDQPSDPERVTSWVHAEWIDEFY
jgi:hypothetical protein